MRFFRNRSTKRIASRQRRCLRPSFRTILEFLEHRLAPSTLVVSTTADSGGGSLRAAITQANADGSGDTITFSVTGVIQLASALPALSGSMNIDGPGASSLTIEPASGVSTNIFTVDTGVTANISALTMTNGSGSGGNALNETPQVGAHRRF
jgi:hypothetical protein